MRHGIRPAIPAFAIATGVPFDRPSESPASGVACSASLLGVRGRVPRMVGRFPVLLGRHPGTVDHQPLPTRARQPPGSRLVAVVRPVPAVDRPVAVTAGPLVTVGVRVAVAGRGMSIPARC